MDNFKNLTIYFTASPLQLICINEHIMKNQGQKYKLFFFYSDQNPLAMQQMYKTLNKLNLQDYDNIWMPKIKFLRIFYEILFILKLKFKYRKKNLSFVILDFRNIFMQSLRRFFKNSKFTLIDDGFYSYVAYENFISKNLYLPVTRYLNLMGKLKKWLYFGISFTDLAWRPFNLFTIYADEIDCKNTIFNDLSYLRDENKKNNVKISDKLVYFIGTGMPERGAIKLEHELNLIKNLNNYWNTKGKDFYYVGKRATSKEKLKFFNKNGIKTLHFELPLELVFIESEVIPKHICHMGSTLSKSLSLIFEKQIEFYFIDILEFFSKSEIGIHIGMDEVDQSARNYAKINKNNNKKLSYDEYNII